MTGLSDGRSPGNLRGESAIAAVKDILLSNPDGLHEVIRAVMQEVLEAEMDEALGASKSERTPERLDYRSGCYGRPLVTRVGKLELRVSAGPSWSLLHRAVRTLPAFQARLGGRPCGDVCAGRVDPEVKAITEEVYGHLFSASSISTINKRLDESLKSFAERRYRSPLPTSSTTPATRRCARPA